MVLEEGLSSFIFNLVKLHTSLGLCEEELSSVVSVLEGIVILVFFTKEFWLWVCWTFKGAVLVEESDS